jgi:F-type H+-transporting ATPase subunit b
MDPIHIDVRIMAGVNLDFDLTFIIQLAFVLILMVVLKRFVFDPYLEVLDARESRTVTTRSEADEKKAKADARLAAHEDALASARARALAAKTQLRAVGVDHKEQAISAARTDANATIQAAQNEVTQQIDAARSAISGEVDTLAREIVAKVIGRQV